MVSSGSRVESAERTKRSVELGAVSAPGFKATKVPLSEHFNLSPAPLHVWVSSSQKPLRPAPPARQTVSWHLKRHRVSFNSQRLSQRKPNKPHCNSIRII